MKIEQFLISDGAKFSVKDHPTEVKSEFDKNGAEAQLQANVKRISELQDILYAKDEEALLIIFQAMDAAGKDGAIEKVFSGVNPQGCQVTSFKQPSTEELDHDYLWRCVKELPERGKIGVFNRSHYEEVLVVRVHPEILAAQHLPTAVKKDKDLWKTRFRQIRDFERHVNENGTHVIKFFLNVSKAEQKRRFLSRIEEPAKNWKFSLGDVKERGHWDEYMDAYSDAIGATSTKDSPWYVIPADKKWFARLAISEVILQKLESMKLAYPQLPKDQLTVLAEARKTLEEEQ